MQPRLYGTLRKHPHTLHQALQMQSTCNPCTGPCAQISRKRERPRTAKKRQPGDHCPLQNHQPPVFVVGPACAQEEDKAQGRGDQQSKKQPAKNQRRLLYTRDSGRGGISTSCQECRLGKAGGGFALVVEGDEFPVGGIRCRHCGHGSTGCSCHGPSERHCKRPESDGR